MKLIKSYENCPDYAKGSVVALGNFDGVHIGHKVVIKKTIEVAKEENASSAVMTFEPHPVSFFKPDSEPFRITPFKRKFKLLEDLGLKTMFCMEFNESFSRLSAADFIEQVLINGLSARHVVIGYDFIFGHKRSGNAGTIKEAAKIYGFGFTQVAAKAEAGEVCSSTRIRDMLRKGLIQDAEKLLGHAFVISGVVAGGEKRGRKVGFPTANLDLANYIHPLYGVYAAQVRIENEKNPFNAVVNIGKRPTFDNSKAMLEAHIFDFNDEIYGREIVVTLKDFIRPERKFPGLEELKKQISDDCIKAKDLLKKYV